MQPTNDVCLLGRKPPCCLSWKAVVRIFEKGCTNGDGDHWWHIAYGNLSTELFTVMPLAYDAFESGHLANSEVVATTAWVLFPELLFPKKSRPPLPLVSMVVINPENILKYGFGSQEARGPRGLLYSSPHVPLSISHGDRPSNIKDTNLHK